MDQVQSGISVIYGPPKQQWTILDVESAETLRNGPGHLSYALCLEPNRSSTSPFIARSYHRESEHGPLCSAFFTFWPHRYGLDLLSRQRAP